LKGFSLPEGHYFVTFMNFFLPRQLRSRIEFRVKLALQECKSGIVLPGSCSAVMIDISKKGTCLVLSQMLLGGKHLFFSTLNNDKFHLLILIDNPGDNKEPLAIPASSVWMDSCFYKEQPAFKLGIFFHEKQKKIFSVLTR